jgi:hypothetical protein
MLRRLRILRQQNQAAPGKPEAYGKPHIGTGKSDPSPDFMYHAGAEKLESKLKQLKNREWKHRYTLPYWKAAFTANAGSTLILFFVGTSSIMVAVPWIFYQWQEILGFDIEMFDRERTMPPHTPPWWLNEWRKHLTPWRAAESWLENDNFYGRAFDWVHRSCGKDMLKPRTWFTAPPAETKDDKKKNSSSVVRHHDDKNIKSKHPRALVPMCGDSPIIKVLANAGYEVDGIDCVDMAIRELSDRLEVIFSTKPETLGRIHLHLQDVFAPHAWKNETGVVNSKEAFDFIWDRQGITAVDPDRREDYAFLLKKALKPDGVIYVEGMNRTSKRRKNRDAGPPFHFGEEQLAQLFPRHQGFRVKCMEMRELVLDDLDPESKVTGIIPEWLLARPFPCAIWKDATLMKELALL